ncbi:TPA: class C sortase SrtC1, partial [Streptococcus agalactiae]
AKLFTNLDKVTVGDRFYIEHIGGKIAYQVDQIKVIAPDQLEDLYVIQGEDHVTLLTCTPYMINSHRLLVRGKRIPYVEKTVQKDSKTFRQQQYLTYAMWVVVGLILLSLLIWFKKTKQKKRRKNEKAASQNSHNNSK